MGEFRKFLGKSLSSPATGRQELAFSPTLLDGNWGSRYSLFWQGNSFAMTGRGYPRQEVVILCLSRKVANAVYCWRFALPPNTIHPEGIIMNHRKSIVLFFSIFFLLSLASAASGAVGDFEEKGGADNPFNPFNSNGFFRTSPAIGDLTGDGKLEAVIGYWDSSFDGKIGFFALNESNQQYESDAAFSLFDTDGATLITGFGNNIEVKPTLFDWDGDENLDLFVGTSADTGKILYFRNNGSNGFVKNDDGNPFKNINGLGPCKATFGNFFSTPAGIQALVGTSTGTNSGGGFERIQYYEQSGGFFQENEIKNPMAVYGRNDQPNPFAVLYDEDNLIDVLVGTNGSNLRLFQNIGTETVADYGSSTNLQTLVGGNSSSISTNNADPVIVKYDGDNRKHLFVGSNNQGILYFVEIVGGPGDYNDDGDVNLDDAILALKIVAGVSIPAGDTINLDNRISGEAIGIEEAIYALRKVAGF
jgi:hypothetical protein